MSAAVNLEEERVTGDSLWEMFAARDQIPMDWLGDPRRLFAARETKVAACADIHMSTRGERLVDGEQLRADDLVLLTRQRDPRDNGIWRVKSGPWKRTYGDASIAKVTGGTVYLGYLMMRQGSEWVRVPADSLRATPAPPTPHIARAIASNVAGVLMAEAMIREFMARAAPFGCPQSEVVVWKIAPKFAVNRSIRDGLFSDAPGWNREKMSNPTSVKDFFAVRAQVRKLMCGEREPTETESTRVWVKAHARCSPLVPNPFEPLNRLLDMGFGVDRLTAQAVELVRGNAT